MFSGRVENILAIDSYNLITGLEKILTGATCRVFSVWSEH